MAAAALIGAPQAGAANRVTVSSVAGQPGAEVSVTVSLTSDTPVAALQVSAALGDAAVAVSGTAEALGRAESHAVSCGTKDGVTTLMIYSTTMAEIAVGDGPVAEFTLRLGASPVAAGPVIEVKATDASGRELACSAGNFDVTVEGATAVYPSGPAYDYGRVAIRGSYQMSVPVTNSGTSDLVISSAAFSSDDFECASSLPMTIRPGATQPLVVAYSPEERGDISATLTVGSNSSRPDNTLRLLAQPFAVNEVHVGDVSGISDSEVTVPVSVNNMDPITGFTMEFTLPSHLEYVDGSFALSDRSADHIVAASIVDGRLRATAYSLTDTPFSGNDGMLATFRVRLSGRNSVSLSPDRAVLSALIGGKVTDVTSATYAGRVSILYPQISASGTMSLGRTPITEDAQSALKLSNYGTAPLTVERIATDGIDLQLDRELPFEIASGATENVGITLSGTAEGSLSGTLQIYSNDPEQRLFNVSVTADRYAPNSIRFNTITADLSTGDACLNWCLTITTL